MNTGGPPPILKEKDMSRDTMDWRDVASRISAWSVTGALTVYWLNDGSRYQVRTASWDTEMRSLAEAVSRGEWV
jgi:hypothetical protein